MGFILTVFNVLLYYWSGHLMLNFISSRFVELAILELFRCPESKPVQFLKVHIFHLKNIDVEKLNLNLNIFKNFL